MKQERVVWRPKKKDLIVFKVQGKHPELIVQKKNKRTLMFVCRALHIKWQVFAKSMGF